MVEFIVNLFGVWVDLVANRVPLMGELGGYLPLRPLTSRHRCDMPVRWLLLLFARLINRQVVEFRGFCRRSP